MSVAHESVYANDVESKVTTNCTESPYECADVSSKDIPSETTAQKFRKSSSITKLLALLGLITFLMFIALLVMPFALKSSWRQDAKELKENWEQVVNRIMADLTRIKGDMYRHGERISKFQNKTVHSIGQLEENWEQVVNHIMANLTRMKGDMYRHGERISKFQNKTVHSIEQLNESTDNLLNKLTVGQSMRSLIEANVDNLKVSIKNMLRIESAIQAASGWHISGNFVYKHFSGSVSYLTASSSCQNMGGRLAATILRDPNAIRDIIQKYDIGKRQLSFWIGYDDRITEGSWQWADGGDANSFVIWDSGQPDNSNNEDCAHVWNSRQGKLFINDDHCNDDTYSYFCEFSSL